LPFLKAFGIVAREVSASGPMRSSVMRRQLHDESRAPDGGCKTKALDVPRGYQRAAAIPVGSESVTRALNPACTCLARRQAAITTS
jgi:hypothetical protein